MADATQYIYKFQELAELLVKDCGISNGHWGVLVRFGLQAANVPTSPTDVLPAAIIPILELGIQKYDEPNSLTVDASQIADKSKTK